MNKTNNIFADRLMERRRVLNMSREQLCEKLDCSLSKIAGLESGYSGVRPEYLRFLAEVLETTPAYLFGMTDDPSASMPTVSCPVAAVPTAPPAAPQITLKADPLRPSSHCVYLTREASNIVRKLIGKTRAYDWKIVSDIIVQAEKYIRVEDASL